VADQIDVARLHSPLKPAAKHVGVLTFDYAKEFAKHRCWTRSMAGRGVVSGDGDTLAGLVAAGNYGTTRGGLMIG